MCIYMYTLYMCIHTSAIHPIFQCTNMYQSSIVYTCTHCTCIYTYICCTSNLSMYKHVYVHLIIHCIYMYTLYMYIYIRTFAVYPIFHCTNMYMYIQSSIVWTCTIQCTSIVQLFIAYQTVQCSSIRPCNCILLHLIVHSSHLSISCWWYDLCSSSLTVSLK